MRHGNAAQVRVLEAIANQAKRIHSNHDNEVLSEFVRANMVGSTAYVATRADAAGDAACWFIERVREAAVFPEEFGTLVQRANDLFAEFTKDAPWLPASGRYHMTGAVQSVWDMKRAEQLTRIADALTLVRHEMEHTRSAGSRSQSQSTPEKPMPAPNDPVMRSVIPPPTFETIVSEARKLADLHPRDQAVKLLRSTPGFEGVKVETARAAFKGLYRQGRPPRRPIASRKSP